MKELVNKFKTLGVKEWFAIKNELPACEIDTVLEVREKAIKVTMISCGRTTFHWIPKSVLEFVDAYNEDVYTNCNGLTIDEAIEEMKCLVSTEELIKLNRQSYLDYC